MKSAFPENQVILPRQESPVSRISTASRSAQVLYLLFSEPGSAFGNTRAYLNFMRRK
jgi:hypothetical protein